MQRTQGLDVKIVRPLNIYGPRTRFDDRRAVQRITQALSGRPITGSAMAFSHAADYRGPLNVGNDRKISVLVARYVSKLDGVPIDFEPSRPQDPTNRRPDLTNAHYVMPEWSCSRSNRRRRCGDDHRLHDDRQVVLSNGVGTATSGRIEEAVVRWVFQWGEISFSHGMTACGRRSEIRFSRRARFSRRFHESQPSNHAVGRERAETAHHVLYWPRAWFTTCSTGQP
ncbi:UNVERIFIED_ORG: hypothetical protein M2435_006920 [Rhizobium sophorae]|nr:hypothetical protein [Rhizobium sophorae]